jgi:ribosomal-protein-alanine N-acetyltransferase
MIRDASVYDIPRINELGVLLNENFEKLFNINEMLQDDISKVIVYEKDDKVVGFIIATALYETCDILSIVVDPEYRRQGIGTNLIGYLISDLGEVLKLVTLEVATKNKEALALYDKFGFEVVHTREHYYNGDDAYLMARKSV